MQISFGNTHPDPSTAIAEYANFFNVEFLDFHGALFARYPGMKMPPKRRIPTTPDQRLSFELDENHVHCDFALGDTPRDRWLSNLALGRALQKHYELKLRATFPDRNVVFSLLNEMVVWFEPTTIRPLEIMTTLRYWTRENDPGHILERRLKPPRGRTDIILHSEDYGARISFVEPTEIFSRTGQIRKTAIRKFCEPDWREDSDL